MGDPDDATPALRARTSCPLCGAAELVPILDLPYDRGDLCAYLDEFYSGRLRTEALERFRYVLQRCGSCGFVHQRWVPSAWLLRDLYGDGGIAASTGADTPLSIRVAYTDQVEALLRYVARPANDVRVLDFGAGSGRWLAMAGAYGLRTAGAELDAALTERVAAAGHEAYAADDLPVGSFDFVNAEQVVEHLVDPMGVAIRLARSLTPGGVLRIAVPNCADVLASIDRRDWTSPKGTPTSLNAIAPLEHINCFTPSTLEDLGRRAGLEPFAYPLRVEVSLLTRVRFVGGAVRRRLRRTRSTVQLFRKRG